jgi:hypothetical protein
MGRKERGRRTSGREEGVERKEERHTVVYDGKGGHRFFYLF